MASRPADHLFYLGDVYETGTRDEFERNYGFKALADSTYPILGNHEYDNRYVGYFPFWAELRGSAPPHFYDFWISGWQILALNSEGGLSRRSRQYRWVRSRLNRHPGQKRCRLILSHRPRWSAGSMQDSKRWPFGKLAPIQRLASPRVAAWISAHEHNMQRLKIGATHQFISGAGGKSLYPLHPSKAKRKGLRWASTAADGALRLRFTRSGQSRYLHWWFVDVGGTELDAGRIACRVASRSSAGP